VIESTVGVVDL
jgi:hypothetical protein